MSVVPFCVLERPFMVWGHDLPTKNARFLEGIDADFYYRTAQGLVASLDASVEYENGEPASATIDDEGRKDISSLSRLLWHHGVETLIMLLGAYMQAPGAVQAYILKCKTEHAIELGNLLLRDQKPKYNRLRGEGFSLQALLLGIHARAHWPGSDTPQVVDRFSNALTDMLDAFTSERHRWEYNSIKHGLRAHHGTFALAFGIQESPGRPAPPEAMQTLGYSKDASFFSVVRPLDNATREQSKVHFTTNLVSVSWSLEKVLMELQLLSLFIGNTVSALRIANGAAPGTVKFNKVADDTQFWEEYERRESSGVPSSSFGPRIDAGSHPLPTADDIFRSYDAHQRT